MSLEIKVQASKDYLRVDKYDNNRSSRISESIASKKILQRDAELIAELIANSITNNIHKGKRYDTGGPVAALKKSTRDRKGHSRVFLDTGKLFTDVIVKKYGRGFIVKLSDRKYPSKSKKPGASSKTKTVAEIGAYLQEGNANMKARPFFGINKKNLNTIVRKVLGTTRSLSR